VVVIRSNSKTLLALLKQVSVAAKSRNKKMMKETCEITVTDGKATFAIPGAIFTLDCITYQTCKASISFFHLYDIVRTTKDKVTEIIIKEGEINVAGIGVSAKTTFFETDRILRTVQLPINYTEADLLRMVKDDLYTWEELNFNKLAAPIYNAEKGLENSIKAAYKRLKQYGVSLVELEELTKHKLYSESFSVKVDDENYA
jgi:hypothetical protein